MIFTQILVYDKYNIPTIEINEFIFGFGYYFKDGTKIYVKFVSHPTEHDTKMLIIY